MKLSILALVSSLVAFTVATPLDAPVERSVNHADSLIGSLEKRGCNRIGCCTCDGGYVVACCVSCTCTSFQFKNPRIMANFIPRMAAAVALKDGVWGISELGSEIIPFIYAQLVLYPAPSCRKGGGPGWCVWRRRLEEPLSSLLWRT
mgnify:CR=1 FL=1